jgi:hypothetical protein
MRRVNLALLQPLRKIFRAREQRDHLHVLLTSRQSTAPEEPAAAYLDPAQAGRARHDVQQRLAARVHELRGLQPERARLCLPQRTGGESGEGVPDVRPVDLADEDDELGRVVRELGEERGSGGAHLRWGELGGLGRRECGREKERGEAYLGGGTGDEVGLRSA